MNEWLNDKKFSHLILIESIFNQSKICDLIKDVIKFSCF